MKTLIAPRIHLNGDRASVLLEPIADAYQAVNQAIEAVQKTSPNARNYYVISENSFSTAVYQHSERLKLLRSVAKELLALHEAIDRNEIHAEVPDNDSEY